MCTCPKWLKLHKISTKKVYLCSTCLLNSGVKALCTGGGKTEGVLFKLTETQLFSLDKVQLRDFVVVFIERFNVSEWVAEKIHWAGLIKGLLH